MKARKLELKDKGNGWHYRDMVSVVLAAPLDDRPLIFTDVNKRAAIQDELEKANGVFYMSEDQFAFLFMLANRFDWRKVLPNGLMLRPAQQAIRAFMQDLEESQPVELGEPS